MPVDRQSGRGAQAEDPPGCVCPQDYVEPNCPAHDPEGTYYPRGESEEDRLRRQLAGAVAALDDVIRALEAGDDLSLAHMHAVRASLLPTTTGGR